MALKRKQGDSTESTENGGKKLRLSEEGDTAAQANVASSSKSTPLMQAANEPTVSDVADIGKGKGKAVEDSSVSVEKLAANDGSQQPARKRRRKLAPSRPFPLVPTSVSATGPRTAHKEGKNIVCISRRNNLGFYLRKCKDVVMKDGYKTLHLSAMGAAIPLLLQLSCALPPILSFPQDEIHTEVMTGTCEVQDEILPDDDDEDITVESRFKSTVQIVIKIGDGKFEGDTTGPARKVSSSKSAGKAKRTFKGNGGGGSKSPDGVFAEPEQEEGDLMETV